MLKNMKRSKATGQWILNPPQQQIGNMCDKHKGLKQWIFIMNYLKQTLKISGLLEDHCDQKYTQAEFISCIELLKAKTGL